MLPFKENALLHYSDYKTLHPSMYSCVYISICLSIFWETILHGFLTSLHMFYTCDCSFFLILLSRLPVYKIELKDEVSLISNGSVCTKPPKRENFSIKSSRQACLLSIIKDTGSLNAGFLISTQCIYGYRLNFFAHILATTIAVNIFF